MQNPFRGNFSIKPLCLILPPFLTAAALGWTQLTLARDYKVGGGLTTGYERYDRQYDQDDNAGQANLEGGNTAVVSTDNLNDKYDRFRISPLITVTSLSARDELSLRYSPSFRYDDKSNDHDVDHNLYAGLKYSITRDWLLKLTESYLRTDARISDSTAAATDTSVTLSDDKERRQYWTNSLGLVSDYSYWEDSVFSLGYTFNNLRNIDVTEDSTYEDYDRHVGSLSVGHRFNSVWKLTATGNYVRGLYDVGDRKGELTDGDEIADKDLSEYRASTILDSRLIEHNPLSLAYKFVRVEYDAADRAAVDLHDMTAGWLWEIAKDLNFSMGAGPSFQKTEGESGNWGYNANANVKYALERTALGLSLSRGYDVQNFTGTDENGLREFWQSRFDASHQILENVELRLFASYRNEDQEEITSQSLAAPDPEATTEENRILTETINRQRYGAGSSLGYKFARWYSMNLSYNYLQQDSEKVNDSYDEHRLVLSLSVEKELFNW